jgi:hypothetical protein
MDGRVTLAGGVQPFAACALVNKMLGDLAAECGGSLHRPFSRQTGCIQLDRFCDRWAAAIVFDIEVDGGLIALGLCDQVTDVFIAGDEDIVEGVRERQRGQAEQQDERDFL